LQRNGKELFEAKVILSHEECFLNLSETRTRRGLAIPPLDALLGGYTNVVGTLPTVFSIMEKMDSAALKRNFASEKRWSRIENIFPTSSTIVDDKKTMVEWKIPGFQTAKESSGNQIALHNRKGAAFQPPLMCVFKQKNRILQKNY
jgi:hypothetical protein